MFQALKISAAAAVLALSAVSVAAQGTQTINVANRSGVTLYSLHASAVNNNSWENDLLGNRTLGNRQTFSLTINNVQNCMYDFRMEFTDGDVLTDVVNICQVGTYTIRP